MPIISPQKEYGHFKNYSFDYFYRNYNEVVLVYDINSHEKGNMMKGTQTNMDLQ